MARAFFASAGKSRKRKLLLAVIAVAVASSVFTASYSVYYDTNFTVSHVFYGQQNYTVANNVAFQGVYWGWGNNTVLRSGGWTAANLTSITFMNESHGSSYLEVVGDFGADGINLPFTLFTFSGWIIGHIAGNLRPSGIRINVNTLQFDNNSTGYIQVTYMEQMNDYSSLYQPENGTFYLSPYRLSNSNSLVSSYPINVSKSPTPYSPLGYMGNFSLNYSPALLNEPLFSSNYYNFMTPLSISSGPKDQAYSADGGTLYRVNDRIDLNVFLLGLSKTVECSIDFIIVSSNPLGYE